MADGMSSHLGQALVDTSVLRRRLLSDVTLVGGVYHMGFSEANVISNDLWKQQAGGIPRHCFLVATTIRGDAPSESVEDEEVLLLRVVGTAPLPRESDLVEVRESAMRAMLEGRADQEPRDIAIVDVLTRNEMQFNAFKCQVLGTFYEDAIDGSARIAWGADVDTLYSASRYLVYKPRGDALSFIASYPNVSDEEEDDDSIELGHVRYSSTRRRATQADQHRTSVRIRVADFISMKTAVFGMTRTGKSNTMKTIATAVFTHAQRHGRTIGQLLFDPAGEYANVNVQDRTALAAIGEEHVRIYRYGATGEEAQRRNVRPLQINFYAEDQLHAAVTVMSQILAEDGATYVQRFLGAEFAGPAEGETNSQAQKRRAHASRGRLGLYATLVKAQFTPPSNFDCRVSMARELADQIQSQAGVTLPTAGRGFVRVAADDLTDVVDWLVANIGDDEVADWAKGEPIRAVLPMYEHSRSRSGYTKLVLLRRFHSPAARADYAEEIYADLAEGRIVIVDLSRGTDETLQVLSERVITHILDRAVDRFAEGHAPVAIQIFLEEAHRLFDRERFARAAYDPYVRLAKEAAKYEIGLVYATQEVTSVEDRVLSNTSNWIVQHLNNAREVKALAQYYDFAEFTDGILRAEDRGFARVKTLSCPYIVPVQVNMFGPDLIDRAVEAAASRVPSTAARRSLGGQEPSGDGQPSMIQGE